MHTAFSRFFSPCPGLFLRLIFPATALAILLASPSADALTKTGTWHVQAKTGPDAETGGWFINLGITGARAKLTEDAPTELVVTYVFKGTPAHGVLAPGDRITGANHKKFRTPHRFGYGMAIFGYEGPMMDFGKALEDCQDPAQMGKLTLEIIRGEEKREVALSLPTEYGRFSESFPFNCPKTDRILSELYEYLADQQRPNGGWPSGRPHLEAFAALALLASGEARYEAKVERAMRHFAENTDTRINYDGGYDCWKQGLFGICLAEYYLQTGKKWVLPELQEINQWLVTAQFAKPYRKGKGTGGWGHRPSGRPGGNGYGPICAITAQAMAAWSLIEQCGIEINRERYQLAHEFLARGTNNIGYVWYADGNGGDDKYADMGRTGASIVAHAVSISGGPPFRNYALKSARCIGDHPDTFTDTHGSPILGLGWTALGALADEASFRKLMDHHVWHFNLSHCHDGTFYYQPNRDSNPQDFTAASRFSASAATALILSAKHRSLRVLGAAPEGARR